MNNFLIICIQKGKKNSSFTCKVSKKENCLICLQLFPEVFNATKAVRELCCLLCTNIFEEEEIPQMAKRAISSFANFQSDIKFFGKFSASFFRRQSGSGSREMKIFPSPALVINWKIANKYWISKYSSYARRRNDMILSVSRRNLQLRFTWSTVQFINFLFLNEHWKIGKM